MNGIKSSVLKSGDNRRLLELIIAMDACEFIITIE
jgi:hypothetical protein